jgi:hypothetical protein
VSLWPARAAGDVRSFSRWWTNGPRPRRRRSLLVAAAFCRSTALLPRRRRGLRLWFTGFRLLTRRSLHRLQSSPTSHEPTCRSRWHPLRWEQDGRQLLREKTAGDRVGELTGSMLGSALIAGVLTLIMTAIGGEALDNSPNAIAGPAWLWLMTTRHVAGACAGKWFGAQWRAGLAAIRARPGPGVRRAGRLAAS